MKASFALLAICNVALLALTAVMGLGVDGAEGFGKHFLLGLLAALYACFVQVVAFMYFVVQEKIVRQSALAGDVPPPFHERMLAFKFRALRLSLAGIGSIIVAVGLGAGIGIYVSATAHLVAAFAALGINGWTAIAHYGLLHEYRQEAQVEFGE
jgi:hypothetical protein